MNSTKKIRVLIVDDSATMRKILSYALSSDPRIEVVGAAPDPLFARELLLKLKPDVITLDIEMPKMDGLTFLEKVMSFIPTRTLIFSSIAQAQSATAIRALELGAIDVLEKPSIDVSKNMEALTALIVDKVVLVSQARLIAPVSSSVQKPVTALHRTTHKIISIASSTGGTEALKVFLAQMPPDLPGTVISQHMPAGFTKSFADALNAKYPFEVKEAQNGDRVLPGRVLIAPGNFHMEIERSGGYYITKLHQEPLLHGVRPAADYMMKSVATFAGKNAIGIVLTGMGKDGAQGLLEMKKAGALTFAQSEKTCVVFGMPGAAVNLNAVDHLLDLDQIAPHILQFLQGSGVAA
jgi:two-component system, chemotaxis family, protein-glutamate methylesterase/glutaminase